MDKMNKKGWIEGLLMMMIIGIVAIIFFAGWIYASGLVRTELNSITGDSAIEGNISVAAQSTYNYYDDSLKNGLPIVSIALIIGFMIATFILAYFSIEHPAIIFVYVIFIIVLFISSVYMSNFYEDLLSDATLGATLNTFTASNFVVLHLPLWVTIVGFIGIILMVGGRFIA